MKKLFLDTNVVIDLLDKREGFYKAAVALFTLSYKKEIILYVSPMTYATAAYLLRKQGEAQVKLLLRNLRQLSEVTTANEMGVDDALASAFKDYEDALQYYSALKHNVDCIITRNVIDFKNAKIPVLSPDEFLASL